MGTSEDLARRPGIRRVVEEENIPDKQYTPTGQQTMESHVIVPAFIALIVAIVCTFIALGVMLKWFVVDAFILMCVFGLSFLVVFLRRVGVGDRLLWAIEEFLDHDIDGDGAIGEGSGIGYAPRDIPLNSRNQQRNINMPTVESKLTRQQWERVAIATLNQRAKVSRRGLTKASKLAQSEAALAAKLLHDKGRAKDNELNGAGWDWLIVHLPENVLCMIERPHDPPTHENGGWQVVEPPPNQPTNQPTSPQAG